MKIKTSELTGKALNYAVGILEGWELAVLMGQSGKVLYMKKETNHTPLANINPSTNWGFAGHIIEREGISLWTEGFNWEAKMYGDYEMWAKTPLVAAMRCYVESRLGLEVEVPDEIIGERNDNTDCDSSATD